MTSSAGLAAKERQSGSRRPCRCKNNFKGVEDPTVASILVAIWAGVLTSPQVHDDLTLEMDSCNEEHCRALERVILEHYNFCSVLEVRGLTSPQMRTSTKCKVHKVLQERRKK